MNKKFKMIVFFLIIPFLFSCNEKQEINSLEAAEQQYINL